MGRYTLLLVLAAVAGGSYLSFSALRTQTETGDRRAGAQSAVLARQLAESGQAIALTSIIGENGFNTENTLFRGQREYRGGTINFEDYPRPVASASGTERATILVSGVYGESTHRLRSVYDFDPMDFPGPVWLDVPYATTRIKSGARIGGDKVVFEPQVDPTKNNDLNLARDGFSLDDTRRQLAAAAGPSVPTVPNWEKRGGGKDRTADLNGGSSADDLYYQLFNAVRGMDRVARTPGRASSVSSGPRTLSGTIGAPDAITLVEGDVRVTGRVTGKGALVVKGDLRVSGTMIWDGLVVVRSETQHAVVDLGGEVRITGALVVSQEAYPPGGHIDLTVFRMPSGELSPPWGHRGDGPGALRKSPNWPANEPFRWFEHTHRFDQPEDADADRDRRLQGQVRFVDSGNPQDRYTGLKDMLRYLGSKRVRIEFARVEGAHGHSVYDIVVNGGKQVTGTVARGFHETALEGPSTYLSESFRARDLERLTVQPRSRRSLRKLWDGSGSCDGDEWPYCVGEDRNRRGALGVRIVDAGNPRKVYYEGTIYWHMQTGDEQRQYRDDKAEWQAGVASGRTPFGTDFTMGPRASVTYEGAPIVALAEVAGFKGNQVIHISTESDLTEVNESRAARASTSAAPVVGPDGKVAMCDKKGKTKNVDAPAVDAHLAHGCTLGACRAAPPGTPTGQTRTNPAQPPTAPCPNNGTWEWDDGRWECDD